MFLLIYFLACFPQAVLFACICFLSSFARQQPGSFRRAPAAAPPFSVVPWVGKSKAASLQPRSSVRVDAGWTRRDSRGPLGMTSPLLLPLPGRARTRGQLVKTHLYCMDRAIAVQEPHPLCTLPGVGDPARARRGLMPAGCLSRRHPPSDRPSIPRQSQQGQRLAARGGEAGPFEATPALAP